MPQPTLGDVHVNRPLTNISVAYSQEAAGVEFVADRAFPAIPVENKSDLYWTYNRADFNRDEMQKRALASESAGSGYDLNSTGTYNCDVWALHKDVDDQIRANSDSPLSPDRDATIFLTNKALIRRENQWAVAVLQHRRVDRPGDRRSRRQRVQQQLSGRVLGLRRPARRSRTSATRRRWPG